MPRCYVRVMPAVGCGVMGGSSRWPAARPAAFDFRNVGCAQATQVLDTQKQHLQLAKQKIEQGSAAAGRRTCSRCLPPWAARSLTIVSLVPASVVKLSPLCTLQVCKDVKHDETHDAEQRRSTCERNELLGSARRLASISSQSASFVRIGKDWTQSACQVGKRAT